MERQKKPTRQVACEITKDGVVIVKSTQLGEWNLEAIQAHADFLSLKDAELNLKELKASRHTCGGLWSSGSFSNPFCLEFLFCSG